MPGRKRMRTAIGTDFVDRIFDCPRHGCIKSFGDDNQAKLVHPIVFLLPHQVTDKHPTQHSPFHIIVYADLLHGIFAREKVEIVHPVYRRTDSSDCNQGCRKNQTLRIELILHDRHTLPKGIGSRNLFPRLTRDRIKACRIGL